MRRGQGGDADVDGALADGHGAAAVLGHQALGHVHARDHNAFNCTPTAVLNISRDSMATNGWSPATRVFEAAGAGACLITDTWKGVEQFLEPDREVLVAADVMTKDSETMAKYVEKFLGEVRAA